MRAEVRKYCIQLLSFVMAITILSTDVFAIVKEVEVFGAQSINEQGFSDNKTTLEQLKDDYSHFSKTDTLREFFIKRQEDPYKVDMDEAISWLIDNEIIIRDQTVMVSGISDETVPVVNISKYDIAQLPYQTVSYSDMIMYMYKAIFGPIDARTIGVEIPNIRVDNSQRDTLQHIFDKHNYPDYTITDGIIQDIKGGSGGTASAGGDAGDTNQEVTTTYTSSEQWRYTPQGDFYENMFGDTNIFISDVNIDQSLDGGDGGDGGNGGDGPGGGSGGGGGAGGNATGAIQYETDYKQIYYKAGKDLMFYRTNDVLEVYIRAMLSKGLFSESDFSNRTTKFTETFLGDNVTKTQLDSWNPFAAPYIFNRSKTLLMTVKDVKVVAQEETLGVNYNLNFSDNSLIVTRQNLFDANSGYFKDENVTKLDFYRTLYRFIYTSEKKLTNTEADIVNYKYGMELEGVGTDEDIEVLKYLIAKGLINFEDLSELTDMYLPLNYATFCTMIYRAANPDARYDFSKVQLTDSDSQWKAKGYAPQTVCITSGTVANNLRIDYGKEYFDFMQGDGTEGDPTDPEIIAALEAAILSESREEHADTVSYNDNGALLDSTSTVKDLLDKVETRVDINGDQEVLLGDGTVCTVAYDTNSADCVSNGYYRFGFEGITVNRSNIKEDLMQLFSKIDLLDMTLLSSDNFNWNSVSATSTAYDLVQKYLFNVYTISMLIHEREAYNDVLTALNGLIGTATMEKPMGDASALDIEIKFLENVKAAFEGNVAGKNRLTNIQFKVSGGSAAPTAQQLFSGSDKEIIKDAGNNLSSISFTWYNDKKNINYEFVRELPSATSPLISDVMSYEDTLKMANEVSMTSRRDITLQEVEAKGIDAIVKETTGASASQSAYNAANSGSTVQQYGSANRNYSYEYISWEEIHNHNQSVTKDSGELIPLEKISDTVLHNTETDTYAYFCTQDGQSLAIVGTEIVRGDPGTDVYYTEDNGRTHYYLVDAIRLLMNAKQESEILGGKKTIDVAPESVRNSVGPVAMISESGASGGNLMGVRALLSSIDSMTMRSTNASASKYYRFEQAIDDTRWGNYLSLTQTNRVANVISRKFSYKSKGSAIKDSQAYAVVYFKPGNVEELGTIGVNSSMSLQDLLDAPSKPPDTEAGQVLWTQNKERCNKFANWIYGTSGEEYFYTGYLIPEVYFYYDVSKGEIPSDLVNSLGDLWNSVHKVQLDSIMQGAVTPIGKQYTSLVAATGTSNAAAIGDPSYKASYQIAHDYSAIILCNRIYMHEAFFDSITGYKKNSSAYAFKASSMGLSSTAFSVGSEFRFSELKYALLNQNAPTGMVTGISQDGEVTCQVGPIIGLPVNLTGVGTVILDTEKMDNTAPLSTFSSLDTHENNKYFMLKSFLTSSSYPNIKVEGIYSDPSVNYKERPSEYYVCTGSKLVLYSSNVTVGQTGSMPTASTSATISDITGTLNYAKLGKKPDMAYTYLKIKFSAYDYTIQNGVLTYDQSRATNFLSPALFTNLNDMLVDSMLATALEAVPINEVPENSLVEIGTSYAVAVGSSAETKMFVGLGVMNGSQAPKIQDLRNAFASHQIRGGNQYMNISHFFDNCQIITTYDPSKISNSTDSGNTGAQQRAIEILAKTKMSIDGSRKVIIYGGGGTKVLAEGDASANAASSGYNYAPYEVRFNNALLAYKVAETGSGADTFPVYRICSFTSDSSNGIFANASVFNNAVLDDVIKDRTTDVIAVGYSFYNGFRALMDSFHLEFSKDLGHDIFTLVRMLMFIIIVWLLLASWICYGFYYGNLMPIIESIKNPTTNRSGGGFDLFKIISLGTITADTEFRLGRFIQYDLILAVLMVIVWKTGNISF